jgi:hypothetical protein
MANSVFEADGGIHKLNDESVNTIFGNIGKVPKDPKWGKGPPLEPKEKKVLKEQLQVLAEEPWRQQHLDLMLRYHDILSKDKFDLGCADVGSNRGQPLTVQLGGVLRSEEAASQCSTWRSGTTTRSTRF